jgi:hypothetical protein
MVGSYARRWTIHDSSFLGNSYRRIHSANSGLIKGVPATVVAYGGYRYGVRANQAAGASVNPPSGTTNDNAYWLWISVGAPDANLNIPAWFNGVSVREGGTGWFDNASAENSVDDFYQEGGESPLQYQKPTLIKGGIWGSRTPVSLPSNPGNRLGGDTFELMTGGKLGKTLVSVGVSPAVPILTVHNDQALSGGIAARIGFANGYELDGQTPALLGTIEVHSNAAGPAAAEGIMVFTTRTYAGTGGQTDRVVLDGANLNFRPDTNNGMSLGLAGNRWNNICGTNGDFINLTVNGNSVATLDGTGKVLASQLPSYVDDVLEYANFAALPRRARRARSTSRSTPTANIAGAARPTPRSSPRRARRTTSPRARPTNTTPMRASARPS